MEAFKKYADAFFPIVDSEPLEEMKWAKIDQAYAQDIIERRMPDLLGGA